MTLRTIESEFTEQLLKDLKEETSFDLTLDAPIINRLPPKVIWAKLQFENNPEQEPLALIIPGQNYDCFETLSGAIQSYPQIELRFEGRPWAIFKYLSGNYSEAIIDFGSLGAVVLSKTSLHPKIENKLHWHTIPHWLSYALSPELWGPLGKWNRFHGRLHHIFIEYQLLNSEDFPGYYPLNEKAKNLEEHGFQGTNLEKSYLLVLPWTFSLSSLEKLEKSIRQEL